MLGKFISERMSCRIIFPNFDKFITIMTTNILIFILILIVTVMFLLLLRLNNYLKHLDNNDEKINSIVKFSLIIGLFLIVFSFFAPYFFTSTEIGKSLITTEETGFVGDTMGGIMNPFIAIAAAILTFIAFWIQFKANQQQTLQFKDQAKDVAIERFENKFYNLIEIHRNNVTEVRVGNSTFGRKTFISMFNELKFTHLTVIEYYDNTYKRLSLGDISDDILFNISYLIFFFGVGDNSSKVVKDLIGSNNHIFFTGVENYILNKKTGWKTQQKLGAKIAVNFSNSVFELDISYTPCNGHMSRLSHYIRNLFQIVKYIDEQDEKIFSYENKFQYAGTLRSQLSNHEQLLLYYNAVSVLGQPWIDAGLLKKYCMIRSLPIPLADFYKTPLSIFPEINEFNKTMFEWTEIRARLKDLT